MAGKSAPRILLLSAYDAGSHQHWRRWLVSEFNEFLWTTLALPDRHFYWRIRSNALTFVTRFREELSQRYDLIIATSMTDIATLRGLAPNVADCPVIVYFHENQFAYPVNNRNPQLKNNLINARLNSILTAVPATTLVFNSEYNRRTFLAGIEQFVKQMPDGLDKGLTQQLRAKSVVLPVPVISARTPPKTPGSVRQIVWNHRWEYDKQPEIFFAALQALQRKNIPFKLHVMGQSFRKMPACFADSKQRLADRIETWGYQSRDQYLQVLEAADIVVSTAVHDFQGLGMLEAIHRGCVPVAPRRVAYPEYIPAELLYDPNNEVESLSHLLQGMLVGTLPEVPRVDGYLDTELVRKYKGLIARAIEPS